MIPGWILAIIIPFFLVVGIVIGFIFTRLLIKKYMDKNPPINEDVIRTLYQEMGRKPSERQIQNMLQTINEKSQAPLAERSQQFTKRFQNKTKRR